MIQLLVQDNSCHDWQYSLIYNCIIAESCKADFLGSYLRDKTFSPNSQLVSDSTL